MTISNASRHVLFLERLWALSCLENVGLHGRQFTSWQRAGVQSRMAFTTNGRITSATSQSATSLPTLPPCSNAAHKDLGRHALDGTPTTQSVPGMCIPAHLNKKTSPQVAQNTEPCMRPDSHCSQCSSTAHQHAQALAQQLCNPPFNRKYAIGSLHHMEPMFSLHNAHNAPGQSSQRPTSQTSKPFNSSSPVTATQVHTMYADALAPNDILLPSHQQPSFDFTLTLPRSKLHRPQILEAVVASIKQWRILDTKSYTRGWGSQISWGIPALSIVIIAAFSELLLLPMFAPGGGCLGTWLADGLWSAAGLRTDLAGLLAASTGLEAVQAFSLTRKLCQLAVLDVCIRVLTSGKPRSVFGMKLRDPLNKEHGWYWWACWGLVGLAAVSLAAQTAGAAADFVVPALAEAIPTAAGQVQAATSQVLEPALSSGDQRMLPFRCRLWADTCLVVPVMEETLFRGFMLATLTKYMPVWGALVASSAAFAACHLGHAPLTDLPLMTGWGCVLGLVFLRSRNLLAPIAAHSMNNTTVLLRDSLAV